MSNKDNIRMRDRSWSQHMWERIKAWLTGLDERVTDLEEGGGGGGGDVTGVKGDAETTYRRGNVNLTAANIGAVSNAADDIPVPPEWCAKKIHPDVHQWEFLSAYNTDETKKVNLSTRLMSDGTVRLAIGATGSFDMLGVQIDANGNRAYVVSLPTAFRGAINAKALQTAVADPTASGEAITFIDSISQNAEGVISPTKKTVRAASQSESGLMSSTDKAKVDGLATTTGQVSNVYGTITNNSLFRWGNICKISVWITLSQAVAGINARICDIPAQFCPSSGSVLVYGFTTYADKEDAIVSFRVTSSGTLITFMGSQQVRGIVKMDATYII